MKTKEIIGLSIGFTALRAAVQENKIDTVKLLCEMSAKVNVKGDDTPLYSAAAEGHLEIVKILIAYGADINNSSEFGVTPLQIACIYQKVDVIKYLLQHGAIIQTQWRKQKTGKINIRCYKKL